jgi:hypothetical protein
MCILLLEKLSSQGRSIHLYKYFHPSVRRKKTYERNQRAKVSFLVVKSVLSIHLMRHWFVTDGTASLRRFPGRGAGVRVWFFSQRPTLEAGLSKVGQAA